MSEQRQHGGRRLAGFWRRALASLIDAVLIGVVAIAAEAGLLTAQGVPPARWRIDPSDPAQPVALGAVLLMAAIYDVWLTRRLGGTIGKRALGLRVEAREGGTAGLWQLVGRLFARAASVLPLLLGLLWVLWDGRKQAWHDKLADTVVVRDGPPLPAPVRDQDEAETTGELRVTADVAVAAGAVTAASGADALAPESASSAAPHAAAAGAAVSPAAGFGLQPGHPEASRSDEGGPVSPSPAAPTPPQPPPVWQTPGPSPYGAPAQPPPYTAPASPYAMPSQHGFAAAVGAWPSQQPAWGQAAAPGFAPPPPAPARNDPNAVAIGRAGLGADAAAWLQQVADQVDARLDRVSTTWRTSPHAEAARACAFGLLLGQLARLYPHMRPELNATAELHPSFSTLMEGARLATLEQIVAEPSRVAAWLGPLIDVHDPARLQPLLD